MNSDRTMLTRQLTLLVIFTIAGSALRLLPYWKEEYQGWLLCIWGANAILPLFMVNISKCRSLFWGYVIPLLGFIVSDLLIEWILREKNIKGSSLQARLAMYAIFLVLAQLGLIIRYIKLPSWQKALTGVGLTLIGSCLFFLFTNFLIWMRSTPADGPYYYEPTWAGLIICYEKAYPFFQNQFIGDAIFSAVFFGIYALVEQRYLVTNNNPATATV